MDAEILEEMYTMICLTLLVVGLAGFFFFMMERQDRELQKKFLQEQGAQ